MKPIAIVTGASGYLGQALCDELTAQNWLVRRCSRQVRPDNENEWVRDDPENQVFDPALFDQVNTVFHLAGLAHQHHAISPDAYARANVEYTKSVASRAAQAGVQKFLLISSVAAVTDATNGTPVTPQTEPSPQTPYGQSKLAAERVLQNIAAATSMNWIVVRPPLIYGANPKGNLAPLVRLCRSALPLPFGAIRNQRSMIALKNLNHLLVQCAHPQFEGTNRTVMPADVCLSTPELVSAMRAATQSPPRLFKLPASIYDWLVKLPIIGHRAQVLRSSLQLDDPWLRDTLKWQPPHAVEDQIHAMVGKS